MARNRHPVAATLLALATATTVLGLAPAAEARSIIKQPNNPYRYTLELEPHILFAFDNVGWGHDDDAFGPGVRFNVPIVEDGPIKRINNSMAIGFGVDWAHGECDHADCDFDALYFPVVLQWNFWMTDIISVFGEPGLAFRYTSYDGDRAWCVDRDCDHDDLDLRPVFAAGGRFMFSEDVGAVVRLGWPYVSAGVTFLL